MDLLLVCEPDDPVAVGLASVALSRGRRPILLDHDQAGRLFSVASAPDGARVEPEVPIMLRPRTAPPRAMTPDERFLRGEAWATLWAAAALAKSPVINRPGPFGAEGRWSPSGAVTEARAAAPATAELFLSQRRRSPPPDARPWAIEPYGAAARRWLKAGGVSALGRARPLLKGERYECVTVLGDQAWRGSTVDLPALELEARSIEAARKLDLAFVTVTWGIDAAHDAARLARIAPYPSLDQLWPIWAEVTSALLETLTC